MSIIAAVLSIAIGALLGLLFYGGLWLTVRRLATTDHPVLLTLGSFWIRLLVVLTAFVWLARSGLANGVIAMASFILGRLAVSRVLPARRPAAKCT